MRYTDLGVGHPVTLRKIVRDCFGSTLVAPANAMDVVDEDVSADEDQEVYDEEEEECDEIDDEELDDEDDGDDGDDGHCDEVDEDVIDDTLLF